MTILFIVLASVAAWLFIGFYFIAPMSVRRQMEAHVRDYPSLSETSDELARWRREAAAVAVVPALGWPFYLAGCWLTSGLGRRAPLTDHELKVQGKEQAARIAELERELREGR